MNYYQCKTEKLTGSSYDEVLPLARESYRTIANKTKRTPYVKSPFFGKKKVFLIIFQAGNNSGSLITARLAADQGREVFAMPGNVRSGKSTGSHRLLKEGACLVERAEDILNELHIAPVKNPDPVQKEEKNSLALPETTVLKALDSYPVHIDTLALQTGIATGPLSAILLNLELQGRVVQHPGKHFSRT